MPSVDQPEAEVGMMGRNSHLTSRGFGSPLAGRRPPTIAKTLAVVASMLAALLVATSPASADRSGPSENDQIARLYIGVLDRLPDAGGEVYWNHRDLTLRAMAAYFVDSPEFKEGFGTGNQAILAALYQTVLGRSPDPSGYRWWLAELESGRPLNDVVVNFTESAENVANSTRYPSRYDAMPGPGCSTPLDEYFADYVAAMGRPLTAHVHDLRSSECSYGFDETTQMPTASTVKLAVMGAVMLRAQDQGRSLTSAEQSQLDGMIRFSDDGNVRPILNSFGGSDALLTNYGPRLGITNWRDDDGRWGCITWDARSATGLVEHLTVDGVSPLSEENRTYALELMTSVTPSQRWGISDGTLGVLEGAVAQKNGFARGCTGTGSKINTVGLVLDADGLPLYSVAIYSIGWSDGLAASRANDQPTYVLQARGHMDNLAEHIARMMTREATP